MSSTPAKGVGRSNRPAKIDTAKKPVKSTTTALYPTPETAKFVVPPKPVAPPETDPPSSGLSDAPDSDAEDEPKDKDLGSGNLNVAEAAPETGRKHTIPASESPVEKRIKADKVRSVPVGTRRLTHEDLEYQTIKAINVPPRTRSGTPDENENAYGAVEKYENVMLTYWLDEVEMTYAKANKTFAEKFPVSKDKQPIVEEAVRRRHIRVLNKLVEKYGKKSNVNEADIGKPVLRRGRKRKSKAPGAQATSKQGPTIQGSSSPAGTVRSRVGLTPDYVKNAAKNAIEKAAIVVWRDLTVGPEGTGMSFKEIRDKLDNEYGWSVGTDYVERLYHQNRSRVYNSISNRPIDEEEDDGTAEQDVKDDADTKNGEDGSDGEDLPAASGSDAEEDV